MLDSVIIQDAEISIVGLTFIVSYRYYKGCPATYWQPADEPSVDILNLHVKNQSDSDPYEILSAIKVNLRTVAKTGELTIDYDNGDYLIEQYILKNPPI